MGPECMVPVLDGLEPGHAPNSGENIAFSDSRQNQTGHRRNPDLDLTAPGYYPYNQKQQKMGRPPPPASRYENQF